MTDHDAPVPPPGAHDATALDTLDELLKERDRIREWWGTSPMVSGNAKFDLAMDQIQTLLTLADALLDALTAANARVEALERENAELRNQPVYVEVTDATGWKYVQRLAPLPDVAAQPSASRSETPAPAPTVATKTTLPRLTKAQRNVLLRLVYGEILIREGGGGAELGT